MLSSSSLFTRAQWLKITQKITILQKGPKDIARFVGKNETFLGQFCQHCDSSRNSTKFFAGILLQNHKGYDESMYVVAFEVSDTLFSSKFEQCVFFILSGGIPPYLVLFSSRPENYMWNHRRKMSMAVTLVCSFL